MMMLILRTFKFGKDIRNEVYMIGNIWLAYASLKYNDNYLIKSLKFSKISGNKWK